MEGKDKKIRVRKYKGYFICPLRDHWRVKTDPELSYAIHHGSFETVGEAKDYIDSPVLKPSLGPVKYSAKKVYDVQFTLHRSGAVSLNGVRHGPGTFVARALADVARELDH